MPPISTYADALTYIYAYTNRPRKQIPKYALGGDQLARMRNLLERVGNPQRQYPIILVAGTKGKGSTAAMCESILRAAGYKTGLFISPRLHTFRERVQVGGQLISEAEVIALINQLYPHCQEIDHLITFERMAALAFLAYARAAIDIAVVEVGLGGRLDATNVTDPTVSVITSISYDHTHLLGNTLSQIAQEKAGIIRPHGQVVSAPQYLEPMTVIEEVCRQKKAQLTVVGDKYAWRIGRANINGQTIHLNQQTFELPLLGRHQAANAATALATMDALESNSNFVIPPAARKKGLAKVQWPARLEILNRSPFLIIDSAMNGDSARKLRHALAEYFPGRRIILIFGSSKDHDYTAMLKELLPIQRHTIATKSTSYKATEPADLATAAAALGHQIAICPTIPQALADALDLAEERDIVCVAGSLFVAADARLAWFQHAGLPLPETDPI